MDEGLVNITACLTGGYTTYELIIQLTRCSRRVVFNVGDSYREVTATLRRLASLLEYDVETNVEGNKEPE